GQRRLLPVGGLPRIARRGRCELGRELLEREAMLLAGVLERNLSAAAEVDLMLLEHLHRGRLVCRQLRYEGVACDLHVPGPFQTVSRPVASRDPRGPLPRARGD